MNRLTWVAITLAVFMGVLPGRGVAQNSPNPEQQGQELQQVVESTFGPKYNLGYFVDVDYALNTESDRFSDPDGTLQGTVLFSAIKGNMIAVGVYREGNVLWTDQWEAVCISGTGFKSTRDLNRDGTVELVYAGIGCRHQVFVYWIYSWDGQQGTFINKDRKAILTDFRSTGRFVDLTGDGILEIVGWRELREELVFENGEAVGKESIMERVAYSWNGQEYGQWPSTPDPPEDDDEFAGSIPRDQMTIRVEESAQRINSDTFQYQYEVTNAESSRQSLHDIFAAPDTAAGLQQPTGWNGVDFVFFRIEEMDSEEQVVPEHSPGRARELLVHQSGPSGHRYDVFSRSHQLPLPPQRKIAVARASVRQLGSGEDNRGPLPARIN